MSLASSYAKALYQVLLDQSWDRAMIESLKGELQSFSQFLEQHKQVYQLFTVPTIHVSKKAQLVEVLAQKLKLHPLLQRFLKVLGKHHRIHLLRAVVDEFFKICLGRNSILMGKVWSAEPLSQTYLQELAEKFSKKLGEKIVFQSEVDSKLLAGLRVYLKSQTYDNTLSYQLNCLHSRLVKGWKQ